MGKTETFTGLNTDLERLANRIETYLYENGFEVAFSKDQSQPPTWFFIQARKISALRTAAGARRSTDITIRGLPDKFEVSIGTGEWGKNILSSAPLFIVPIVGIAGTIVKLYTAKRFEDNLWRFIRDQGSFLNDSAKGEEQEYITTDSRSYDCDYIEGYPGWKENVIGGKLLLFRERGGRNRVSFKSPGGQEIAIPAANITGANIIPRKKGFHKNDSIVQIECKDDNGKNLRLRFNINNSIIRGVIAGIDELVGEDTVLREFEEVKVNTDVKSCITCGASIPKDAHFCPSCGQKQ